MCLFDDERFLTEAATLFYSGYVDGYASYKKSPSFKRLARASNDVEGSSTAALSKIQVQYFLGRSGFVEYNLFS